MIDEVSISNFKSIFHQSFALGRVNVFVGSRGSGKTNILEGLGMASAAHDDALDRDSLIKRGINPTKMFHSMNDKIEIVWYEKNSWKKAKLVSNDNGDTWRDISWYETAYIDKINNLIQFIGDGSIQGQYPFADEAKNSTLNAAFRGSRNFRDFQIYRPKPGDVPVLDDETAEKIFSIFTPQQVKKLQTLATTPELMFYLSLFSERRTPVIFAIDNIENFIAPDACSKLMPYVAQLAIRYSKQAYITTSNPAVVKGMDLSLPEQKLFLVKKEKNGQTTVKQVEDKTLLEI